LPPRGNKLATVDGAWETNVNGVGLMRVQTKPEPSQPREPVCSAAHTAAILMVLNGLVLASATAMAQTLDHGALPSSPANTAASPTPKGAVEAFENWVQQGGVWMQQGVANMGAGFGAIVGVVGGQTNQAARDAAEAARHAATSVSKLPNAGIAGGHERCVIAPNGAPDCRIAAETMCRAKGYAGGASVDFVTVENCPPPYRTSRREAPEGVCTMEHFVTKALCQ
jgi:hypothetical protein